MRRFTSLLLGAALVSSGFAVNATDHNKDVVVKKHSDNSTKSCSTKDSSSSYEEYEEFDDNNPNTTFSVGVSADLRNSVIMKAPENIKFEYEGQTYDGGTTFDSKSDKNANIKGSGTMSISFEGDKSSVASKAGSDSDRKNRSFLSSSPRILLTLYGKIDIALSDDLRMAVKGGPVWSAKESEATGYINLVLEHGLNNVNDSKAELKYKGVQKLKFENGFGVHLGLELKSTSGLGARASYNGIAHGEGKVSVSFMDIKLDTDDEDAKKNDNANNLIGNDKTFATNKERLWTHEFTVGPTYDYKFNNLVSVGGGIDIGYRWAPTNKSTLTITEEAGKNIAKGLGHNGQSAVAQQTGDDGNVTVPAVPAKDGLEVSKLENGSGTWKSSGLVAGVHGKVELSVAQNMFG